MNYADFDKKYGQVDLSRLIENIKSDFENPNRVTEKDKRRQHAIDALVKLFELRSNKELENNFFFENASGVYEGPLWHIEPNLENTEKYTLCRYISEEVYNNLKNSRSEKVEIQLEHVIPRKIIFTHLCKDNLKSIRERLENIAKHVKCCVVTKNENKRLSKDDSLIDFDNLENTSWNRYKHANPPVKVFDLYEDKEVKF